MKPETICDSGYLLVKGEALRDRDGLNKGVSGRRREGRKALRQLWPVVDML